VRADGHATLHLYAAPGARPSDDEILADIGAITEEFE